jgi:hypothetical protein
MSNHEAAAGTAAVEQVDPAVLDALRGTLDRITMDTPVERIVAAGRSRRRGRRAALVAGAAAVGALAVAVPAAVSSRAGAPEASVTAGQTTTLHIVTAAFTVDHYADGTVSVSWAKSRYFSDPAGLQRALQRAGLPTLVKSGEFCKGPGEDGSLNVHGQGPGIDRIMTGRRNFDGSVSLVFDPAAVPAGEELFIGYLTPAQLAVTDGHPGSVERLVPVAGPLSCTSTLPAFGN